MRNDLDRVTTTGPDMRVYSEAIERSREHFAHLVGVDASAVAIASQTSVVAGLVAAGLPDGAEVLCVRDDFSSMILPFVHAGRGIHVRFAELPALADAITSTTELVSFSLVQSATGEVADAQAVARSARERGARTFCDATQAVGWLPVDATMFDAVVCHAYKWLCAPRGVAFLVLRDELVGDLRPVYAGWYAGEDPWASCYGGHDARRFDVSPAWPVFVGAEPALGLFAGLDPAEVYAYTTALAASLRVKAGLPAPTRPSAIVTWPDAGGRSLARLAEAGITASGRNGRVRVALHIFNDAEDVEMVARALGW
ncbi:aminotransferase class V-fold PLP-dependent enzyme [Brooklawnia cerclae]|uniref:Selenocysteine lyase/cysteine desulfurase n=1 Tax=Brooklawnia cerclae TaxID=349934 RepID=A0ABX0SI60_9ACTN|nr:aminotransferase class V-fold PLP-dependent enzyme [Brooklawnia cerclae]NIH57584.1 selenocysteine lyase/cysteine desulfurase [Brooklawnia cerclae]